MHVISHHLLAAAIIDAQIVRWVVWVGLVVLTVVLLLLIRTRWGQSQPLSKCVVLSLLAHLLLGIYTTTVNIVKATVGSPDGKGIHVALVDATPSDTPSDDTSSLQTWEAPWIEGADKLLQLVPRANPTPAAPLAPLPTMPEVKRQIIAVPLPPEPIKPEDLSKVEPEPTTIERQPILARDKGPKPADPIDMTPVKPAENTDVPPPEPLEPQRSDKSSADKSSTPPPAESASPTSSPAADGGRLSTPEPTSEPARPLPAPYQWRMGNHAQIAKGQGATPDTESAVTAALKWLAERQDAAGRWEARRWGGGAGRAGDGQDRDRAGAHADVGVTGLALLAFLASGNTHLRGTHQATVRHGLEYLLSIQDASGSLGASDNRYERMYCHAMATCALSEAYAMTSDERLQPAVRRAIGFTLAAQDRASGGWRYQPGDPGDTSQLGWQVMALKSAELGGFAIPPATRLGIERYLKSVALGRDGGLACYQPGRPLVSRSMTAEALACREFLNLRDSHQSRLEATGALVQELPGSGSVNFYYWYYATLALYQLQGDGWQQWNKALQRALLTTQRFDGEFAGSWDPDPVWGGCGGRVYSTALGALCLEVYYRFLPLYVEAAGRDARTK